MKDTRTISNTPRIGIEDIALEVRKRREWNEQRKNNSLSPLTCPRCNESFMPKRYWQRFCTPECRLGSFKDASDKEIAQLEAELKEFRAENKQLKLTLQEYQK